MMPDGIRLSDKEVSTQQQLLAKVIHLPLLRKTSLNQLMVEQTANSRYWNSRRTRSSTMPQIPKTDYLKVLVLFSLFAICFHSALKKFAYTDTISTFQLNLDYSLCKEYENDGNKLESCKKIVVSAYVEAELKCKGFVKQYDVCKEGKHARCHTELNNIEGCINAIVQPYFERRKDEIRKLLMSN